jgi:hypothetical protein
VWKPANADRSFRPDIALQRITKLSQSERRRDNSIQIHDCRARRNEARASHALGM